jgi:hypothetical protein
MVEPTKGRSKGKVLTSVKIGMTLQVKMMNLQGCAATIIIMRITVITQVPYGKR